MADLEEIDRACLDSYLYWNRGVYPFRGVFEEWVGKLQAAADE